MRAFCFYKGDKLEVLYADEARGARVGETKLGLAEDLGFSTLFFLSMQNTEFGPRLIF